MRLAVPPLTAGVAAAMARDEEFPAWLAGLPHERQAMQEKKRQVCHEAALGIRPELSADAELHGKAAIEFFGGWRMVMTEELLGLLKRTIPMLCRDALPNSASCTVPVVRNTLYALT